MSIKDGFLDILVKQGRVAALGSEIGKAQEGVMCAKGEVDNAEADRVCFVESREEARGVVRWAKEAVMETEVAVQSAQKAVREAKSLVVSAEKNLAAFSDETLIERNEKVAKCGEICNKATAKVHSLENELEAVQKEIQGKKEELKEQGFEFSFVAPRPPKTTYL